MTARIHSQSGIAAWMTRARKVAGSDLAASRPVGTRNGEHYRHSLSITGQMEKRRKGSLLGPFQERTRPDLAKPTPHFVRSLTSFRAQLPRSACFTAIGDPLRPRSGGTRR